MKQPRQAHSLPRPTYSLTPTPTQNQIREEFSNGISPGRPSADRAAARNPLTAAPVAGGRPRRPTRAGANAGWPFVARVASPAGNGNNAEPAVVGRAVAGGGGGRVAQVAEAAAAGANNELGGGVDARRRRGAKEDRGDYWLF